MNKIEMDSVFIKPAELNDRSIRDSVSPEEWALRVDLAAAYRLVDHYGWTDLIFTHLSARLPGSDNHFLINPYGLMFEEVTASNLVKVDVHGNKVDDSPYPVNPAGFAIHSAVHRAGEDAHCVMHLHTRDGVAVSMQDEGLRPLSAQSLIVCNDLAYHEFAGPGQHADEGEETAASIRGKHFAILRNHGTLTVGKTVADAFIRMYVLETACTTQIRALTAPARVPNQGMDSLMGELLPIYDGPLGALTWPALLRKLDRIDPSFRE